MTPSSVRAGEKRVQLTREGCEEGNLDGLVVTTFTARPADSRAVVCMNARHGILSLVDSNVPFLCRPVSKVWSEMVEIWDKHGQGNTGFSWVYMGKNKRRGEDGRESEQ